MHITVFGATGSVGSTWSTRLLPKDIRSVIRAMTATACGAWCASTLGADAGEVERPHSMFGGDIE